MSTKGHSPSSAKQQDPQASKKRTYQKPAFEHEKIAFEKNALACGKLSNTQLSCKFNRKNS